MISRAQRTKLAGQWQRLGEASHPGTIAIMDVELPCVWSGWRNATEYDRERDISTEVRDTIVHVREALLTQHGIELVAMVTTALVEGVQVTIREVGEGNAEGKRRLVCQAVGEER